MLFKSFQRFDWITVTLIILLLLVGLALIYSIDLSRGGDGFLNFKKQLIAAVLGLLLLLILATSKYKLLEAVIFPSYIFTLLLLVAVLIIGTSIRGSTAWFSLGTFNFQPVELAKFIVILALARYFETHGNLRFTFKAITQSLVLAGIPAGLILLQPDLGGAFLIIALWAIMLIIFGIKKTHLGIILLTTVILGLVAWFFILVPYQKDRIAVFLNSARDPMGAGYNVRQSIIAIGSGRVFGRGLGFGSQSQLKFLPESQTDFIFAVIAEELGFLAAFMILVIFALILYRFMKVTRFARSDFGIFLTIGVSLLFALEFFVNVGMNLGVMPVMGIAAPFLSYGGSSLVAHLLMTGAVLGIRS